MVESDVGMSVEVRVVEGGGEVGLSEGTGTTRCRRCRELIVLDAVKVGWLFVLLCTECRQEETDMIGL